MKAIYLCVTILLVSLISCSPLPPHLERFQQGTYISDSKVKQLKSGMSKSQVTHIMGSPLLMDTFSPDRWEYLYYFAEYKKPPIRKTVFVYFKNNELSKVERQ